METRIRISTNHIKFLTTVWFTRWLFMFSSLPFFSEQYNAYTNLLLSQASVCRVWKDYTSQYALRHGAIQLQASEQIAIFRHHTGLNRIKYRMFNKLQMGDMMMAILELLQGKLEECLTYIELSKLFWSHSLHLRITSMEVLTTLRWQLLLLNILWLTSKRGTQKRKQN